MCRESAVQCEQLFSSAGYIVNQIKTIGLIRHGCRLLTGLCACIVGYPMTFQRENDCAIYYFN